MNLLLAFSPFLVFVVLHHLLGVEPGLIGAAVTSLGLLGWDVGVRRKAPKILEVGTLLLFGALAAYGAVAEAGWSVAAVRLAVDAGLLAIVLVSLAVRQPFTLQYAREGVPEEVRDAPEFLRANVVITGVWAAAFAAMVAVDLAWVLFPALPTGVVIGVTVAALVGAMKFTDRYPERLGEAPSPARARNA